MNERTRIEALPCRAAMPMSIETAAEQDGRFRISGIMNSFGVAYSGRILHPRGFEEWLTRSGKAELPMLANHGDVAGFATIGLWDQFERVEQGMRWGGWLAAGVPLAEEARTLLAQGVLRQVSVGWVSQQRRWVSLEDADLDPHLRAAMLAAGVKEALAFLKWSPIEGSLVDVGDDPGARIGARLSPEDLSGIAAAVAARLQLLDLRSEIAAGDTDRGENASAELRSGISAAAVEAAMNAVRPLLERFTEGLENRLVETIEALMADRGAAYRADFGDTEDDAADGAGGVPAGPQVAAEVAARMRRLAQV